MEQPFLDFRRPLTKHLRQQVIVQASQMGCDCAYRCLAEEGLLPSCYYEASNCLLAEKKTRMCSIAEIEFLLGFAPGHSFSCFAPPRQRRDVSAWANERQHLVALSWSPMLAAVMVDAWAEHAGLSLQKQTLADFVKRQGGYYDPDSFEKEEKTGLRSRLC
jgi:hypothetical protein